MGSVGSAPTPAVGWATLCHSIHCSFVFTKLNQSSWPPSEKCWDLSVKGTEEEHGGIALLLHRYISSILHESAYSTDRQNRSYSWSGRAYRTVTEKIPEMTAFENLPITSNQWWRFFRDSKNYWILESRVLGKVWKNWGESQLKLNGDDHWFYYFFSAGAEGFVLMVLTPSCKASSFLPNIPRFCLVHLLLC